MKLRDLTQAQGQKICDYMFEKYGEYNEHGILKSFEDVCKHCPYRVAADEGWYECCLYNMEEELDPELEEVIKND